MAIIGNLSPGSTSAAREIVGNAADLAAQRRLTAQRGMVVIDPATRRQIGGLFDCRDLGPIDAGSGIEPVRAWRVLGESITVSRFEALRGPARTQLIGREEEISLLQRLLSVFRN